MLSFEDRRKSVRTAALLSLVLVAASPLGAWAKPIMHLQRYPSLFLDTPTERFRADVIIDADDSTPEIEPLSVGLVGFGLSVRFDPTKVWVPPAEQASAVQIVDALNFAGDGTSPGVTSFGPGRVTVRGFVAPFEPGYRGSTLFSVFFTSRSEGPYTISLELDNSVTTESLFVDEDGTVLDDSLTFGSTTVQVIPEPAGLGVMSCVVGAMLMRRRR